MMKGYAGMKEQLQNIELRAKKELESVKDTAELESLRVRFLGKKGELTAILKGMAGLSAEQRPVIGQIANRIRADIEDAISNRLKEISAQQEAKRLVSERLDVTLPGKKPQIGRVHPLNQVLNEIEEIFIGMGFDIAEGPEVEYDYYNFEALNLPPDHPARDTQDTFYITDSILLRTQTSGVQVHVMEKKKPPIRIIAPGRVYRSDAVDATHSPILHQIEGLVVDRGITMADLVGTLDLMMKRLYGEDCRIRLRPHHFPFTEPSAEVDVLCFNCGGKGCSMCKNEGYVELLGAGMVHPKVLKNCGIDPEEYCGFAFGLGLERVVMRKFGINDMRMLYENDMRFLEQF